MESSKTSMKQSSMQNYLGKLDPGKNTYLPLDRLEGFHGE